MRLTASSVDFWIAHDMRSPRKAQAKFDLDPGRLRLTQLPAHSQFSVLFSQLLDAGDEFTVVGVEDVYAMPLPQAQHIAQIVGGIAVEAQGDVFAQEDSQCNRVWRMAAACRISDRRKGRGFPRSCAPVRLIQ